MVGYKNYEDAYPINSVVITATNTAPAFSGTWELIDKGFAHLYVNTATGYFTANSTNITSVTNFVAIRSPRHLFFRLVVVPKVAITDATIEFGTLNLSALGYNGSLQTYCTGYSDGGNGIAQMAITATGVVQSLDVLAKADNGTIPAGQTINISAEIPITVANMLNSACDKFYWKRTA